MATTAALATAAMLGAAAATADPPTPVFDGDPKTFVSHGVDIGVLGQSNQTVTLRGPDAVSPLVGGKDSESPSRLADGVYEWFRVAVGLLVWSR